METSLRSLSRAYVKLRDGIQHIRRARSQRGATYVPKVFDIQNAYKYWCRDFSPGCWLSCVNSACRRGDASFGPPQSFSFGPPTLAPSRPPLAPSPPLSPPSRPPSAHPPTLAPSRPLSPPSRPPLAPSRPSLAPLSPPSLPPSAPLSPSRPLSPPSRPSRPPSPPLAPLSPTLPPLFPLAPPRAPSRPLSPPLAPLLPPSRRLSPPSPPFAPFVALFAIWRHFSVAGAVLPSAIHGLCLALSRPPRVHRSLWLPCTFVWHAWHSVTSSLRLRVRRTWHRPFWWRAWAQSMCGSDVYISTVFHCDNWRHSLCRASGVLLPSCVGTPLAPSRPPLVTSPISLAPIHLSAAGGEVTSFVALFAIWRHFSVAGVVLPSAIHGLCLAPSRPPRVHPAGSHALLCGMRDTRWHPVCVCVCGAHGTGLSGGALGRSLCHCRRGPDVYISIVIH